ncbi:hypothetical protein SEPCBS119000_004099 [Sporothrix epigloea]|uniref:Ubiquitin-like modifier HUB1 n=1 Tax=Sporothrix epigloea TaxID=1892477 RepID=A0ABP0DQ80_9PEZI
MGDREAARFRSPETDRRKRPSRSRSPPARNRKDPDRSERDYRDSRRDRGSDSQNRDSDGHRDRSQDRRRDHYGETGGHASRDNYIKDKSAYDDKEEYGKGWAADRPKPKKRSGGGFKVKEKRRNDEGGDDEHQDHDHDRDRDRKRRDMDRSPRHDSDRRDRDRDKDVDEKIEKKKKKKNKVRAPPQEFMIVHVNDRLGSKSAIPCMGSDLIKQFKVMVAARIGRDPSEIMLRRQGERPFKNHLTLDDYGITNGVQLDLELDTGD